MSIYYITPKFLLIIPVSNYIMEITEGCVNAMLVLQRVALPPLRITSQLGSLKLEVFPEFFTKGNISFSRGVWKCNKFAMRVLSVYCILRLKHVQGHWRDGNNMEQMSVCSFTFAVATMGLAVLDTMENHADELSFAGTQCLKFMNFQSMGYPSLRRPPGLRESCAYIFALGYVPILVMTFIFPVFLDYHPFRVISQLVASQPMSPYSAVVVDISAGVVIGLMYTQGGGCFFFLLLAVSFFAESMEKASYGLLIDNGSFRKKKMPQCATFLECWRLHNIMQILIRVGSQATAKFLQILLVMATLLGTCSGFTFVKLEDIFPFTIYLFTSLLLPFIIAVIFGLIMLAAIPRENAVRFKISWRCKLTKKIDFARLRACPVIGYSFSLVHNCKRGTALSITDVMMNCLASAILIKY